MRPGYADPSAIVCSRVVAQHDSKHTNFSPSSYERLHGHTLLYKPTDKSGTCHYGILTRGHEKHAEALYGKKHENEHHPVAVWRAAVLYARAYVCHEP